MSIPDAISAVAALRRCMQAGEYARAARLTAMQATLDGLNILADAAWTAGAWQAYRESVELWRAEHEASVRRQRERDLTDLIAALAEVFEDSQDDGRPAACWLVNPVTPEQAARNRGVLAEALAEHGRERRSAA